MVPHPKDIRNFDGNGKQHGYCFYHRSSGTFEGYYRHGLRHGLCTFTEYNKKLLYKAYFHYGSAKGYYYGDRGYRPYKKYAII